MAKPELNLVKADKEQRVAFNGDGQRVIRHDPGKLPEILDECEQALAEAEDLNLFVQSGRPVRIYPADEDLLLGSGISRPRGAITLHLVDPPHMVELLSKAAIHERYDARSQSYKPVDCPRRVADSFLSRGNYPFLKNLSGFVETITITPDGRVIDQPGYDEETGLFAAFKLTVRSASPKSKPSHEDAKKARDVLLNLFEEFPFVDGDKSAALAGIITSLVRRVLPAAPMMAISAPTPGTGKTLIAETFAIIATGRRASVLSLGHDDAEAEKRLAGVLLAGDACILLDNIERPLKGDLLCQVTTQQFVRLRPLGASGMLSIPTHATLVATGNNLSVVGDLKRRVVLIRLDAKEERPEQRKFKRDHLGCVFDQRDTLIRAALEIPLAYLAAGAPNIDGLHPLGGFEVWDKLVRRPLVWLGLADPLKAAEELRKQDPDLENMRMLFESWYVVFPNGEATAAEVVAAGTDTMMAGTEKTNPDLHDVLQVICAEKINSRRMAGWMRSHRDRIVDGMRLEQCGIDGHTKVAKWRIVKCG
ncbi:MAG: hypothetical protein A2143_01805 [Gallionellales bacterium RBG_16_57_15]|nr:MAG: hypothetical protein A2143_01805 [Gallionellales bacterium RBG_16_57_15]